MAVTTILRCTAVVAFLLALAGPVVSDTPVHCLYNTTVGTWTLNLAGEAATPDTDCTQPFKAGTSIEVSLRPPNVATLSTGENGTFTLVYDEGFAIDVGGRTYWAFFKFEQLNKTHVVSDCGQTFGGWAHDANQAGKVPTNWRCYTATKKVDGPKERAALRTVHTVPVLAPHVASRKLQRDDKFASQLNMAQSTWTASPTPAFVGQTLGSVTGGSAPPASDPTPRHLKSLAQASEVSVDDFDPQFDWSDVNGEDFLGPIRDQLQCGSCYAFGSTNSLNARLRIAQNSPTTDGFLFAPQDIVSCSMYSHGCDGGFPYLVAKFGMDHGIVEESCFPYSSGIRSKSPPCSQRCSNPASNQTVFVDPSANYVGGYYGAATEALMMQSIINDGPLAVSMMVYQDLLHYQSGIYQHQPSVRSSLDMHEPAPFQLTNHIVLITGWGVSSSGTKYWNVMNSWGYNWGVDGFFQIVRGVDECAIESMAVSMLPVAASSGSPL